MSVKRVAALCAATAMLCAMPARAEESDNAQKLRQLDIMLMVTGLRCRTTVDDFQPDFQAFEAHHFAELNHAAAQMRSEYVGQFGLRGADRELERVSTMMANAYGNGHPWLGCHDLKMVAKDLAISDGEAPLLAAADQLLVGDGRQLAYRSN